MTEITLKDFEQEATAFLDGNAKVREEQQFRWGEGSDNVAVLEEKSRDEELEEVREAKAWRATKYEAGFGWISGPPELGGRGLPATHDRLFAALESRYDVPSQAPFGIGLGMVAPTIQAHGQEATRTYLPQMYRGDIVACQLFSEPAAGSDLASLQTRAERDGDEWVVNGQKVWTSGAQYSDIGEIICRTDPDLPKHKGLTGFIVDMKAPGVDVRPLRQMTGGASFNEVFFTDVRVPDDHRLGDLNQGWTVALTTLMNERASIGAGGAGGGSGLANTTRLAEMLRHFGLNDDPMQRQAIARLYTNFQVAKYTNQRAMDKIRSGQTPGPELSIAKLALTRNLWDTAQFVAGVLGPRVIADTGEWGTFSWARFLLGIPGMRIAGGTDEVMRNIVGERVLGLPKDPGIDTTSAFRDLKVSTQAS